MRNALRLNAVLAVLTLLGAPAHADERARGDRLALGAAAGNLDLFPGKSESDFEFADAAPKAKQSQPVAAGGETVTIEAIFKAPDADGWYLIALRGKTRAEGFVRAPQFAALPVANTLKPDAGLAWWDKVSPREIAEQKKASTTEEARLSTRAAVEAHDKAASGGNLKARADELLFGNVCSLGFGKKLVPLRKGPSVDAPIYFFLRDATLATLGPDTEPLWRGVSAHINDGSVVEGYVVKPALGSCFRREGSFFVSDVPNQLLP